MIFEIEQLKEYGGHGRRYRLDKYELQVIASALGLAIRRNKMESERSKRLGRLPPEGKADIYEVKHETLVSARRKVQAVLK